MSRQIHSLEELAAQAKSFLAALVPSQTGATLVTLSGELGAGKTAFTKAVAAELGVNDVVNSPTFVLEKIYALPGGQRFARLVHIDAYRLERGAELAPLGFDELMKDVRNLVLLEWPEKVADAFPTPTAKLSFKTISDGVRELSYG